MREIEPLIFLRRSTQAEKNNEAHGMSAGGGGCTPEHQRTLQQRSLNKMAARSA